MRLSGSFIAYVTRNSTIVIDKNALWNVVSSVLLIPAMEAVGSCEIINAQVKGINSLLQGFAFTNHLSSLQVHEAGFSLFIHYFRQRCYKSLGV